MVAILNNSGSSRTLSPMAVNVTEVEPFVPAEIVTELGDIL